MEDLSTIWQDLASKYTVDKGLSEALWLEIRKAYTCKKRHYHNLMHLSYMAGHAISHRNQLADFDTAMYTIFYHDIVYDIKRKDNEEKSAAVAVERLAQFGFPSDKITRCRQQIIATKAHGESNDPDTQYLLDFDLAILGESAEKYFAYTQQVRREYAIYPDFLYNRGRKKVLQHFLGMPQIFKTRAFQGQYEQQARRNLESELGRL